MKPSIKFWSIFRDSVEKIQYNLKKIVYKLRENFGIIFKILCRIEK